MKKNIVLTALFLLCTYQYAQAQIITTIAGGGNAGLGDGGPAIDAELNNPVSIALDDAGNIYIDDAGHNRIRKIDATGIITTIAGTGVGGFGGDNGPASAALLNNPSGLAIDSYGNIYISDDNNYRLRKINASGIITTIAGTGVAGHNGDDGMATNAEIANATGTAVDGAGNVYFAEGDSNYVRKVNSSGIITTIAGTGVRASTGDGGPATSAEINSPNGVAVDAAGNIYISEFFGNRIRKINAMGIISTYAGNGIGGFSGDGDMATNAELGNPANITIADNNLYIPDNFNNRIRLVNTAGIITTIAGNGIRGFSGDGGPATTAELNSPSNAAIDGAGNIYIADWGNNLIRHTASTVSVTTVNATNSIMKLYPNPTNGAVTINIISDVEEQAFVAITNALGEKVMEFSTPTNKPLNVKLDERWRLYFILVTTSHHSWCEKLVVADP